MLEIIQRKLDRLEDIPDELITAIERAERDAYRRILSLVQELEQKQGAFLPTSRNLTIVTFIQNELRDVMLQTGYTEAVADFVAQFELQASITDSYFQKILKDFKTDDFIKDIVQKSKRTAVNELLASLQSDFVVPVGAVLEQAVMTGATYSETVALLDDVVIGDEKRMSALRRNSETIARDAYAVADRNYTYAIANAYEMEWFWYSPSRVRDTRPFCSERRDRYFHRKEIELWGGGSVTPGFSWPQGGTWKGRNPATDSKSIFGLLGGYNCMHSVLPTSVTVVPKADIVRAVNLGYYTPSSTIIQELQLAIK